MFVVSIISMIRLEEQGIYEIVIIHYRMLIIGVVTSLSSHEEVLERGMHFWRL